MTLLLLLALAIPLSCLALFCSLALAGVMTLGGAMQLVAAVRHLGALVAMPARAKLSALGAPTMFHDPRTVFALLVVCAAVAWTMVLLT